MRILLLWLPLCAWIPLGWAQSSALSAVVTQLPTCGLQCLLTAVTQSSCELTNATCLCTNAELQRDVKACVVQACTIRQALTTQNVTATACQAPNRYRGKIIRIANIILPILTGFCVLLRLVYQAVHNVGRLGWDDYIVLAAWVSGIPSAVLIDRALLPNGLARDIWTVPFDHITALVRYFYIISFLYFLQVALMKLALLFFFLRIFCPKPITRRLLWGTIIFNVVCGSTFIIMAFFPCKPISLYWTRWDGEGQGKCLNVNAIAWSHAVTSIAVDIWMLALPLYEVFHLQLSLRKKLHITFMFCVGTFVTVVSILRLQSLVLFAASSNPTWDQTDIVKWSSMEMNVGIICACLPALRIIIARSFPVLMGTTKDTSQPYHASGSHTSQPQASSQGKSKQAEFKEIYMITHAENDETLLIEMDELSGKAKQGDSDRASAASSQGRQSKEIVVMKV